MCTSWLSSNYAAKDIRTDWIGTIYPNAVKAGHQTFENVKTGEKLRYDQGKPGKYGYFDSHLYPP